MKVLVLHVGAGVQWRLMYDQSPLPDMPGVSLGYNPDPKPVTISDDFGQSVSFCPTQSTSWMTQDIAELDALEIEMMLRQARNQQAAQAQYQSDPRNLIMRPGLLSS